MRKLRADKNTVSFDHHRSMFPSFLRSDEVPRPEARGHGSIRLGYRQRRKLYSLFTFPRITFSFFNISRPLTVYLSLYPSNGTYRPIAQR